MQFLSHPINVHSKYLVNKLNAFFFFNKHDYKAYALLLKKQ